MMNTSANEQKTEEKTIEVIETVFVRSTVHPRKKEDILQLPQNFRLIKSTIPCILRNDSSRSEEKNHQRELKDQGTGRRLRNQQELNILNSLQTTKLKSIIVNEQHKKEIKFVFKDNLDLKIRCKNNEFQNCEEKPYEYQNHENHKIFRVTSRKTIKQRKKVSSNNYREEKKSCQLNIRQYHQSLKGEFKSEFKNWCQSTSRFSKGDK